MCCFSNFLALFNDIDLVFMLLKKEGAFGASSVLIEGGFSSVLLLIEGASK